MFISVHITPVLFQCQSCGGATWYFALYSITHTLPCSSAPAIGAAAAAAAGDDDDDDKDDDAVPGSRDRDDVTPAGARRRTERFVSPGPGVLARSKRLVCR